MRTDTFKLPCGVLKDGEIHIEATVCSMTGEVTKQIGTKNVRSSGAKSIQTILRYCLTDISGLGAPTQDILNKMLIGDRDYCLFMVRKVTLGPIVTRTAQCPACEEMVDFDLDIDTINFKRLKETDYEIIDDERIFKISGDGGLGEAWSGSFRYPNGSDQSVIQKLYEQNPIEAEHNIMWRCLHRWGDKAGPFPKNFFETMDLAVINDVRAKFQEALPGLDDSFGVQCALCGATMPMELDPSFLFGTTSKTLSR